MSRSLVCAGHTEADYGYRPAIGSILARLEPAIAGQCFPFALTPSKEGSVGCVIVEARRTDGSCSCAAENGRAPVASSHQGLVSVAKSSPIAKPANWDCFCEIPQLEGAKLAACQTDTSDPPVVSGGAVNGWCYVDASTDPPTGNPDIVKSCPESDKRLVRFVGAGAPSNGGTAFMACELSSGHCSGGNQ